ncbi:MAG: FHA domain-containing protein [Lachnospiraceae bacterium]|nr:FHA domain-containing protein [Lachnospiraceae bacterium]
MDMRTCPKGHFYDGDVNATCPVCEAEKRSAGAGFMGETEPVPQNGGGAGIGVTQPAPGGNSFSDLGETQAVINAFRTPTDSAGGETMPPTTPFTANAGNGGFGGRNQGVDSYSGETMPVTPGQILGFTPVVGWLVCIDGPDKGHDYRIHTGYNQIGRAEHMDICIRGDQKISREKHALIAYDDEEKVFFFGPSEGKNIVRVNGRMVMVPTELHRGDILTIGTSRLIFVPLCDENFDWSKC